MPRPATGSTYESPPGSGTFYAQITVGKTDLGKPRRRSFALPNCRDLAAAEARKDLLASLANKLRQAGRDDLIEDLVDRAASREGKPLDEVLRTVDLIVAGKIAPSPKAPSKVPTLRQLGERWTSGELHKLHPDHIKAKATSDDDAGRLERHVYPVVGDVPVDAFTLDHAELVMAGIPAERSPATRRHVAQLLHRICEMAVFPLRLIEKNPLPRGFLPKIPPGKAKGWVYPDEDATLLASPAVPLAWRFFYGFLHREGPRHSEAIKLTYSDFDLDRGGVALDENKTDDARAWALSPGMTAAIRAWRRIRAREGAPVGPDDFVFVNERGEAISENHAADRYREHLAEAGINRPLLFEKSKARQPIRIHDTRATFITTSLANGKSEAWVQDRTGHKSSIMINRYRRAARTAAELGLGELHPLDATIPELVAELALSAPSPTDSAPAAHAPAAVPAPSRETPRETPEPSHLNAETRSRHYHETASKQLVAPPGLEPGRPSGPGILKANRGIRTVAIRSIWLVLKTVRDGRRVASPIRASLSPIRGAPPVLLLSR